MSQANTTEATERYPDIEIYLKFSDATLLTPFLKAHLEEVSEPQIHRKGARWPVSHQGQNFRVQWVPNAVGSWSSLWFNSDQTPWATDQDAAQAAAKMLNQAVRCSPGPWQPGDDPDAWLEVTPQGEIQQIQWPEHNI